MVRTNELVAARMRAGVTQEDCGRYIGCSKNVYCQKENNKAKFDVVEVTKFCEFLEINDYAQRAYIFLAHVSHFWDKLSLNHEQKLRKGGRE